MPAGLGLPRIRSLELGIWLTGAGDGNRTRDPGMARRRVASTLHPQMVLGGPGTGRSWGEITSGRCPSLLEAHLASCTDSRRGARGPHVAGPAMAPPAGLAPARTGAVRWGAPARGGRCNRRSSVVTERRFPVSTPQMGSRRNPESIWLPGAPGGTHGPKARRAAWSPSRSWASSRAAGDSPSTRATA